MAPESSKRTSAASTSARVEQAATNGDIYTTKTIRDMLIGTPHTFEHAGAHELKGFEGDWILYRISTTDR